MEPSTSNSNSSKPTPKPRYSKLVTSQIYSSDSHVEHYPDDIKPLTPANHENPPRQRSKVELRIVGNTTNKSRSSPRSSRSSLTGQENQAFEDLDRILEAESSSAAADADFSASAAETETEDSAILNDFTELDENERLSNGTLKEFAENAESSGADENLPPEIRSAENPEYWTLAEMRSSMMVVPRNIPQPQQQQRANTRNSDLIWFQSGIPPNFDLATNYSAIQKNGGITNEADADFKENSADAEKSAAARLSLYPDLSRFNAGNPFDSITSGLAGTNDADYSEVPAEAGNMRISYREPLDNASHILRNSYVTYAKDFGGKLEFNELSASQDRLTDEPASSSRDTLVSGSALESPGDQMCSNAIGRESQSSLPPILTKAVRAPVLVPHHKTTTSNNNSATPTAANVCYVGWLTCRTGQKKKEYVRRWCVLHNGKLSFYHGETEEKPNDVIDCKQILLVNMNNLQPLPNESLNSFEIFYAKSEHSPKSDALTLLADSEEERTIWLTFLTRCIINGETADMCERVDRAGCVYLKKGTTADWENGWLVMVGNTLLYSCENDECSFEVDIRKVMRLKNVDDANDCYRLSKVPSGSSAFFVATEGSSLYVQSKSPVVTEVWKTAIESVLTHRTSVLCEQRLSFDDVPVLVEKCINFIAVHGINVEGIHRLSGTSSRVRQLFEDFQKDSYAVHLRGDDYSVHDVASVLRKFFRQLREPVITSKYRPKFIEISCIEEAGTRRLECKSLLKELPMVNYRTLRKILGHLKSVADNCQTNMMNVQNLSAIFGPTLFTVDRDGLDGVNFSSTSQAIFLTADMILYYNWLFDVEESEVEKESRIQQVANDLTSQQSKKKLAGELLFSIYTDKRDGACFNMQITKKLTAANVCDFAVERGKIAINRDEIALFEVVCKGELERLLSPDETVLDVISRWTTWPLDERANNYLIVKSDYVTNRIKTMAFGQTLYPTCEILFNDSKSFKKFAFQYKQGVVIQLKDSKSKKELNRWSAEDLLWYFGCETKRQPPNKYCLTFLPKADQVKRTKQAPFFGRSMCFKDENELYKWLCTVLLINVNIPF